MIALKPIYNEIKVISPNKITPEVVIEFVDKNLLHGEAGDIIDKMNGSPVTNYPQWIESLDKNKLYYLYNKILSLKQLEEIKIVSKLVRITDKGKQSMDYFWELHKALEHFNLLESTRLWRTDFQDWVARGNGGKLMEAAFNLSILESEDVIKYNHPIPKYTFISNYQDIRGDEDPFETQWVKKIFEQKLLEIK